jgi:hypothetical protein
VGREISRTNPSLRDAYAHELPGYQDTDIVGSPFAIREYRAHQAFGGDKALAKLRSRLATRGLKLVLDFVVNHVAPDHQWARQHPEYFIKGTEEDLAREPMNYTKLPASGGKQILAYGRDPYFAGWPDTLQLNYQHAGLREAMTRELLHIAERCDGVRCDMAMLVQPQVFERTWGARATPSDVTGPVKASFWRNAIGRVKQKRPDFLFIAEVYWDMEWELQQEGFDYTYDKSLYDRLRAGYGQSVREHLWAVPEFQNHSLRFLENHDEPRVAATLPAHVHRAAAVITFLVPGLRFVHEGQFDGRTAHASMHLRRRHREASDEHIRVFYAGLVDVLHHVETHDGEWHLWDPGPAWEGNDTWRNFVAFSWVLGHKLLLTAVNYSPDYGQCYLKIDIPALSGVEWELADLLGGARYERRGSDMLRQGLYLDMPPYGYHVFDVQARVPAAVSAMSR